VLREIDEEAGIIAQIAGLLGVQELPEPWLGTVGILLLCTHVDGAPAPDMRETDAAQYCGIDQLNAFADSLEPQSDWIVRRITSDDFDLLKMNGSAPFSPSPTYL